MCKAMEDMRKEAILQDRKNLAIKMLAKGTMTHEQIAECYELTLDQVKELAQEKSA